MIEVNAPDKTTRRRRGKTDAVDAEAAANAVLWGRATATAKAGDGPVEMVRLFKLAKTSATKSRAQAINQLKAVLVRADPPLREALSGLSTPKLIRVCVALDAATPTTTAAAAAYTLRLLAGRIQQLTEEIDRLNTRITEAITAHTPTLLDRYGVGPDTAAALLVTAGDNPTGSTARRPWPRCAAPAPSRRPPARPNADASTVAATGKPTPRSTPSSWPACAGTPHPRLRRPTHRPRQDPP